MRILQNFSHFSLDSDLRFELHLLLGFGFNECSDVPAGVAEKGGPTLPLAGDEMAASDNVGRSSLPYQRQMYV